MAYWLIASPFVTSALMALYLYVFQPWAKAYAETAAAIKARDERLDKILKEVEAVTRTQEQIKSELSGDLWQRQTVWNQKKELYGELLKTANGLLDKFVSLRREREIHDKAQNGEVKEAAARQVSGLLDELLQLKPAFINAHMLALIFTNDECIAALSTFTARPPFGYPITLERITAECEATRRLVSGLVTAAKKDLIEKKI
jgi:hypothetical protein